MNEVYVSLASGLLGALIGALAAIVAQMAIAKSNERIQEKEFRRADTGVRRQVFALMKHVGEYVYLLRTVGPIPWERPDEALRLLQGRIYLWEVPRALSDREAETLYEAAQMVELNLRFARSSLGSAPGATSQEKCNAIFTASAERFADFWAAVGNVELERRFRAAKSVAESIAEQLDHKS